MFKGEDDSRVYHISIEVNKIDSNKNEKGKGIHYPAFLVQKEISKYNINDREIEQKTKDDSPEKKEIVGRVIISKEVSISDEDIQE